MAKREFCRAEIMERIGYEIEVGSIIRVRKRDELPITLIVTKISRGWYQGMKLILKCEDLSKVDIILQKGKDVLYAMPSGYAQYVGIENSLVKGIRKTDCVGAEGYIVGKVVNLEVLNSILKLAKAELMKETNTSKKSVLNFEEVVEDAKDKFELIKMLRLEKVKNLKKAVMVAIDKKTGTMKPILSELQKVHKVNSSFIKKVLNAELAIWIADENVEIEESTLSYLFRKVVEVE